ncbi:hypothetical protein DFS33DRAFT_1387939 [Desarmillaria ectypa]|nr:hypothetical protein DFS33DRAFT_1387939 [Desarmillaria ectypa]
MEGASSSYPYSGGHRGNGGVVQEFVNETFSASNESSTRSELLSSPSQETGAVQRRRRRRNGPSERFRRERELIHGQSSHKQLLHLVIDQEYEANKMRKAMVVVLERLEQETQRASAADEFSAQLVQRFQSLNEGRLKMHEELIEAKKQLEMYRVQYNHARSEIKRGEEVLETVSGQLQNAERDAVRARSQAHKTEQKRAVLEALIEGRRMGMLSGYAQAQREIGEFRPPQIAATEEYESEEGEGEDSDEEEEDEYEEPPQAVPRNDTAETFYFPPPSRPTVHAAPPTVPSAHTLSPTETEEPLPPRSPSVREFHVEVPPAEYTQPHHHPQYATAPDNFIPILDASGTISMPPPHEWNSSMRAASPQPEESDKKGKGKAKNDDNISEYSYTAPARATSFNASVDTLTGLGILEPDGRGKFRNLDPIRESSVSVDDVPLPPVQGHPSSVRSHLKSPNITSAGNSSPVGISVQTPSSHTPSSAKKTVSRSRESLSSDRPPSRQQPLPHDQVQLSTNHEWDQTAPNWHPTGPPSSHSQQSQGRPLSAYSNSTWQAPPSKQQTPVPADSPPLPNPFPHPRAPSSHSRHKSTGALTPEMVSNPLPSRARTPSMRSQNLLNPDMSMNPPPSLHRVPSNLSQRSHGKFEHFDQESYVDPAIIGGGESQVDLGRIPSRPSSSVGFGLARTKSRGSTIRGE